MINIIKVFKENEYSKFEEKFIKFLVARASLLVLF